MMQKRNLLEVNAAETELSELLALIERGEFIVLTRQGEPIAKSPASNQINKRLKPFESRAELRASQPEAKTSSLETLIALRNEARY